MASAVDTQHLASNAFRRLYDHDPGGTSATIVSPDGGTTKRTLDMSLYGRFGVAAMISVLGTSGALTKLEIIASAAADMSSPEVIKDSGTVDADAVGDQLFEECTAEEVADIAASSGKALRYVAGRITMDAADAECVVYYEGACPRYPKENLTPDSVIA